MAADVSSFVGGVINGGDTNGSATSENSTVAMITRDLLGGCCTLDSKELDLDLQVPCGWEKRLDLKSGKVYVQRCNSSNSSSSTNSENKTHYIKPMSKSQDLNLPSTTVNLFDDASLDLKLVSSSSTSPSSSKYQSVCTLDKVKSALERAEKETARKRSISSVSTKSCSSSSSTRDGDGDMDDEQKSPALFAAGCPSCVLYVLISSRNPKCPRCSCNVPLPVASKKPRIDLNMSI